MSVIRTDRVGAGVGRANRGHDVAGRDCVWMSVEIGVVASRRRVVDDVDGERPVAVSPVAVGDDHGEIIVLAVAARIGVVGDARRCSRSGRSQD